MKDSYGNTHIPNKEPYSSSYYRFLLKNLPYGVTVINRGTDGKFKTEFFNDRFAELVGMTNEQVWDIYGNDATAGLYHEDREKILQALEQCYKDNCEQTSFTCRILRNDGTYFWTRAVISLIRDEKDSFRLYTVYSDITEEREKQEQQREQFIDMIRWHYQKSASNTLVLGHCNITRRTIIKIVDHTNMNLLSTFGDCRDAFFTGLSHFIEEDGPRRHFIDNYLSDAAIKAFEKGINQITNDYFIRIPGESRGRYARFNMNMLVEPDTEDLTGFLSVSDITEQITEDQILHNAAILGNDFVVNLDIPNDCFTLLDKKKDCYYMPPETGRHTEWVRYMAENAVIPEDKKRYLHEMGSDRILSRLESEGAYWVDFSVDNGNGGIATKNVLVSPVDLRIGRVCLLRTDVTEILAKERRSKETTEEALKQAVEANKAKSTFLSRISHDIRTPLNAILNLNRLMSEELDDKEMLRKDIAKIDVAGEFLLQLINDVLDISRIESGNMELKPRVYTYDTFLNYIRGIITPLCNDKDITFVLDEGPTALDIYMDRARFHQVFFNLLSNAVKYTSPGGKVTFRTCNNVVHDGILTCDFVVQDTGCGMNEETIEHAFEPFVRGNSTDAYVGSGLGLAICKQILDKMGATIKIESTVGKGTTVTVHMDLQIATEEQCRESQAELNTSFHGRQTSTKTRDCRILIAEDNDINAEILKRLLEKNKIKADRVSNGREAVDALDSHKADYYQMLLMDVRMPVMDGITATKLIRQLEDETKRSVPIIAITANAFENDSHECLEAGMNGCLAKPISPQQLYEAVVTYIRI